MFEVKAYAYKRVYTYRNGGIIPAYDTYAIEQAIKEGRVKGTTQEEHAFTGYGSTREKALEAVDNLAKYKDIEITHVEFVDW
jgi:hypothetical protein